MHTVSLVVFLLLLGLSIDTDNFGSWCLSLEKNIKAKNK